MITVSLENQHFKTTIQARQHIFFADEPAELDGTDVSPTPTEYLLASLGSCTAITLRMYADRKGWDLQKIDISLSSEKGENNSTDIKRSVTLSGNLTTEQRTRLMQVANACPVHKILSNPINISTNEQSEVNN
jgi:putative redox protein